MDSQIYLIFILLGLFQLKHFICDYPLQFTYMVNGKSSKHNWILPLSYHSLVHALFTFTITLMFSCKLALLLFFADFAIHFVVDRIKASPNLLGRFNISQPYFWWALGFDQMLHHLTHYVFIYFILNSI